MSDTNITPDVSVNPNSQQYYTPEQLQYYQHQQYQHQQYQHHQYQQQQYYNYYKNNPHMNPYNQPQMNPSIYPLVNPQIYPQMYPQIQPIVYPQIQPIMYPPMQSLQPRLIPLDSSVSSTDKNIIVSIVKEDGKLICKRSYACTFGMKCTNKDCNDYHHPKVDLDIIKQGH